MPARKKTDPRHLHQALRDRMQAYQVTSTELADVCCMSKVTFSRKLTAKVPWTSIEMYAIMDHLGVDPTEMYLYFPPGGRNVADARKTKMDDYLRHNDVQIVPNSTIQALRALLNGLD